MSKTIALLTDFGTEDIYDGVMKGVIKSISPDATLIDITHAIAPQHVRQAAFALLNSYRYFPNGTIFMVVVDPGVGTARLPIAVQAGNYTFVAPDNGVLAYVLANFPDKRIYEIASTEYRLPIISNTFHGRDIFSPAVAHLANGVPIDKLGPELGDIIQLPMPELTIQENQIDGEVMHIDRFGNIITSIGELHWIDPHRLVLSPIFGDTKSNVPIESTHARIIVGDTEIFGIRVSYAESVRGDLLALVGSSSYLEIAVNQGNAAQRLNVAVGDRVQISIGEFDATVRD
ncbi:MAG: SAM-dependent chlorinase/fluorinase [Anaerolineae bacterium]|nr:SAM-dependent chlorinase/fluorinase [Anaerolineae bacterium]